MKFGYPAYNIIVDYLMFLSVLATRRKILVVSYSRRQENKQHQLFPFFFTTIPKHCASRILALIYIYIFFMNTLWLEHSGIPFDYYLVLTLTISRFSSDINLI